MDRYMNKTDDVHDSGEPPILPLHEVIGRGRLEEIIGALRDLSIGVIGDLGLDAYWYADMTRSFLSRETPRYPRPVVRESYTPGAGANVAANLKALGVGRVSVLSVLGDDWRGRILIELLHARGIDTDSLIIAPKRHTTTFIKPILLGYDSEQEDARIDFENAEPPTVKIEHELQERVSHSVPETDGFIVTDQLEVNGVVTANIRHALCKAASSETDTRFVVDSRCNIGEFHDMILKPNWTEAVAAVYPEKDARNCSNRELADAGITLSVRNNRPVFVTLSGNGVLVCDGPKAVQLPAARVRSPLDPVGAGDTFISALIAALVAGADPMEAGALASLAAGVSVEKLKETGQASPTEILEKYDFTKSGCNE